MTVPLWLPLLADSPQDPTQSLLSYGVVGALCVLLLGVVGVLWRRDVSRRDSELAAVTARADRLEAELSRVNATVVSDARRAVEDAMRAVTDAHLRLRGDGA